MNDTPVLHEEFLPLSRAEADARGWSQLDFVVVTGDAYVDHPSFGTTIIARLVESLGFTVGILSQPDFSDCESFREYGRPRYAFLIGSGNGFFGKKCIYNIRHTPCNQISSQQLHHFFMYRFCDR